MGAANDRFEGYRDARRQAGLEFEAALVAAGDFTEESGVRAMRELLGQAPDIDAVFAANDLMGAGALAVLAEAGRRVPEDVAVVGFDDSPVARTTRPALSSVRQSLDVMGRELVTLLLADIEDPEDVARKVVLAVELVVRESSGGQPTEG
jgi:DNA-binding LacI/PurR family transcriptional regulator